MGNAYYSCPHIEGGLVFALGDLLLCCITNHGRGCPKACDFTGGELPVERILAFRDEVRAQNQLEKRYPLCAGCGYLVKKEWEEQPYLVNCITIAHYTKCNLRCSYCYIIKEGYDKNPYEPFDLYPTLESMIEKKQLSPDAHVYWGGGEPTIYKDFERTFDLLLNYGVLQEVASDGIVLSKSLKKALSMGKARLICSVDSGTAETYKRIKGRDRFHKVWHNLGEYMKAAEGSIGAKIIVTEENCHEVIPFLDQAQKAGIRDVVYDINFYDLEQSERIFDAIALLIYECEINRGLNVFQGGSVISFGEDFRARINRSLNNLVNWEEFFDKQKEIERLQRATHRLHQGLDKVNLRLSIREEALENLEQSRTVRFTRELNKYPFLRNVALIGYSGLTNVYRFFKPKSS